MFILLYKDRQRSDEQPFKKRIKYGKGKLASTAGGEMFSHYESTVKSVAFEVAKDITKIEHVTIDGQPFKVHGLSPRHEAKLYQKRNEFVTNKGKLNDGYYEERFILADTSANRAFLKGQGVTNIVKLPKGRLGVIITTPNVSELVKKRLTTPKSKLRSSITLDLNSDLHTILSAAFTLAGKERTPGNHVLNVKVKVINENGAPLKNKIGTTTKGAINIHEVRLDKIVTKGGKDILLFNKKTMSDYSDKGDVAGLVKTIQKLIELQVIETLR